jgi:uncharacterized protein
MADEPVEDPVAPVDHGVIEPATRRVTITTADGERLVAEQRVPDRPVATAAIAHPHPQYGGTMHDTVVETVWRTLGDAGVATVRFAFRGSGGSTGTHSGGPAERNDVDAALSHASTLAPDVALLACGYSFGADVTLACDHPAIASWLVVAPPLALFDPATMVPSSGTRPAHLFVAAHDQFAPPDVVRARVGGWPAAHVHVIDMADHFFRGALDRLADAVRAVVSRETSA